jgi:general secretion pathway protein C
VTEEPEEKKLTFDDPLTVPACPGVTVFIVTESDDPLWSFAAVQGQGDSGPKLRRVGDPVGSMKVAYIGYNPASAQPTIWLEGSTLCQAPLFSESEKTKPDPAAAATPTEGTEGKAPPAEESAGKGGGSAIDPEIKSKIKQISETEFEIDRSAVEKILEDQAQLMRSARIVPEQKDGKTIGVRLYGVRPDTLLGTLGLKNGDRLEQINGYDMGSPEKALEAYARLRTAENLKIKLNRRGQSTTIDFKIK